MESSTPIITVVSATAFKVNAHATAIMKTMAALPVPSIGLLISLSRPTITYTGKWAVIDPKWIPNGTWDRISYSRFMIYALHLYIQTDYCITVQWDGYGLNKDKWDNAFLDYDYIGAPWPLSHGEQFRVGNGGFSLRSKKWISITSDQSSVPDFDKDEHLVEDYYFCRNHKDLYDKAGCKIAPIEVAARFSYEQKVEEFPEWSSDKSFGFHGFIDKANEKHRLPVMDSDMKTALLIQNYHSAKERIQWMWPFWKKSGFDLFGIDTEDKECFWPEKIPIKKIGIDAYIEGAHLPQKLIDCFRWFVEDEIFADYTHCCVIENDTLVLKIPYFDSLYAGGIHAGYKLPPMLANKYYHNPWWLSRNACERFVCCGQELIDEGKNECGHPDFFFGYVMEQLEEQVTEFTGTFSQNTILDDWQINPAREAVRAGAWAIHGVKSKSVLDAILS